MELTNTYADPAYAAAYSKLEFPGTYYLAFRDLPAIIGRHVGSPSGAAAKPRALDFGCGTGRSTRFLRGLGFDTSGVDISPEMVAGAKQIDPDGDYRLIPDGVGEFPAEAFDVVLSAFTFDNTPTTARKIDLFTRLARLLKPAAGAEHGGRLVNLVSTPEIYWHEWMSFSTRDFPENRYARCGDLVRIINTALDDRRPAEDILCTEEDYRRIFDRAGLSVIEVHKPLGRSDEPYAWVSETTIAPWAIYVLARRP